MSSKRNKRKLRNYLINFGVQRKIIIIDIIFMMLVMILTMAIMRTHVFEDDLPLKAVPTFKLVS